MEISSHRFILKPLSVDDVSERYVGWLGDHDARRFISAAATQPTLEELRQFVRERSGREDVLFLGIFEKATGMHIGNIKYEPVNSELGYAIMGILVGERAWRGKGVATEVLLASADWLSRNRTIRQIVLGVSRANTAAILTYQKVGFVEASTRFIPTVSPENLTMVWNLKESQP